MKKKVLLSSIMTIALCLCLIGGSTFALFTSTSKVDIAVTAGKVKMDASIDALTLYSVEGDAQGNIVDENGNFYKFVEMTNPADTFTNGGTAKFENGTLTMSLVTPGDRVEFNITGANTSNVGIQYRYIIECLSGQTLMSGFVVEVAGAKYPSMNTYTSAWAPLAVGSAMPEVAVAVELPVTAGNEYQELTAALKITVEAVQGNAVVEDNVDPIVTYIEKVDSADALNAALKDADNNYVYVTGNIGKVDIAENLSNKTIDANGYDAAFVFTGTLENVTVKGIVEEEGGNSINVKGATGTINIVDCELKSATTTSGAAILVGPNSNVVIDNCTISSTAGKTYGIYQSGPSGSIAITDSTFGSFGSWAIQINNAVEGDLLIDNCTFTTSDGVLKVLSGVNGDFTFTNNTMIGCKGHDGNGAILASGSSNAPVSCTGTKTVTGNTLDGADWVQ